MTNYNDLFIDLMQEVDKVSDQYNVLVPIHGTRECQKELKNLLDKWLLNQIITEDVQEEIENVYNIAYTSIINMDL